MTLPRWPDTGLAMMCGDPFPRRNHRQATALFGSAQQTVSEISSDLLNALLHGGAVILPSDYERDAARIPDLTGDLHFAISGFLASTPCCDVAHQSGRSDQGTISAEPAGHDRRVSQLGAQDAMVYDRRISIGLKESRDCAAMMRYWIYQRRVGVLFRPSRSSEHR